MSDISSDVFTTGVISLGGAVTSVLDYYGDYDWFRIEIPATGTYRFDLRGVYGGGGSVRDPFLYLHNSGGGLITYNDDDDVSLDSSIVTALQPGAYFLSAGSYQDFYIGSYTLVASTVGGNRAPMVQNDTLSGALEDAPFLVVPSRLMFNDHDPDGDPIDVVAVDQAQGGTVALSDGQIIFTPFADYTGQASFRYAIADTSGAAASAIASFTVVNVNDAPEAADDAGAAAEDGPSVVLDVLGNDTDVDGGDSKSVASLDTAGTIGAVSINFDGTLSYDPGAAFQSLRAGEVTTDTFSYTMRDAAGAASTAVVTITVTGVNDAPTAVNDMGAATEDGGPVVLNLLDNDQETDAGDSRTLVGFSTGETTGSVTANADGTVTYDPGAGFQRLGAGQTATDTFVYQIADGAGAASNGRVHVTVTGVNDAPTAWDDTASSEENQTLTLDVLANDTDVDEGTSLALLTASAPTGKGSAWVADNRVVFDPGASFDQLGVGDTETVTLSYTMRDERGAEATTTVALTVTGTNDGPVARDDAAAAVEDQSVSGQVLANDSDVDAGDVLTVSGVAAGGVAGTVGSAVAGGYGTLVLNRDGSYSYAADADVLDTLAGAEGLKDVFTYEVSDGNGGTHAATLEISVVLADDERTMIGNNQPNLIRGDQNGLSGAEDTILGGNAVDQLFGLEGADRLFGGNGDDALWGGGSRDTLYGERGADRLDGGAGDDHLAGGQGDDVLTGGTGADRFVLGRSGGADRITDFVVGVDRLVLEDVSVRSLSHSDVDGDGVLDAIVRLSSGSVTLLNTGLIDGWSGLLG